MLQPLGIGHVVLKVRDLDRSLAFYRDLLGFRVSSEMSNVMIFLTATGDSHHDLALLRVGDSAPSAVPNAVGLYHVAIQLADLDAVKKAHAVLSNAACCEAPLTTASRAACTPRIRTATRSSSSAMRRAKSGRAGSPRR